MAQAGEVLRDLRLELDEQNEELGVEVRQRVAGVGIDERGTEARHCVETFLRDRDQIVLAAVVGCEVAAVDADPRSRKRTSAGGDRVVVRWRGSPDGTERGLHAAQGDGDV